MHVNPTANRRLTPSPAAWITLCAVLILTASHASAAPATSSLRFRYGAPYGGIESSNFTPSQGAFAAYWQATSQPSFLSLSYTGNNGFDNWTANFFAGSSGTLGSGIYQNILPGYAPWSTAPSFSFAPLGSSLGTGTCGSLVVHQLDLGPDGAVTDAWLTFAIHTVESAYALMGDFRYNVSSAEPSGPIVDAGPPLTVQPGAPALLEGNASEFGPSGMVPLHLHWTMVSGPGTVDFANPSAPATTATLSTSGTYVLQLTAADGHSSASSDVVVTSAPGVTSFYLRDLSPGGAFIFGTPDITAISGTALPNGAITVQYGPGYPSYPSTLTFAPASGSSLATGTYQGVSIYTGTTGAGATMLVHVPGVTIPQSSVTGSFVIKQLALSSSNTVTSLWVTFTQYADGAAQPVVGEIRINANAVDPSGAPPANTYVGLTSASQGSVYPASLTLGKTASFTSSVHAFGAKRSAVGAFTGGATFWAGLASGTTANTRLIPIACQYNFDGSIAGVLRDHTANSAFLLKPRAAAGTFSQLTGHYTLAVIPPDGDLAPSSVAWGYGFGYGDVDKHGNVPLVGSLPDGSDLAAGAPVTADGSFPYCHLSKTGSIGGWIAFADLAATDFSGTLSWSGQNIIFSPQSVSIQGCRFTPGTLLPGLGASSPNATLDFGWDWIDATSLSYPVTVANGQMKSTGIRLASRVPVPGLMAIGFWDPTSSTVLDVAGVAFLQKQNKAYGIFQCQGGISGEFAPATVTPSP
jgi:hypothetical protein